jgi:hypothetical protein
MARCEQGYLCDVCGDEVHDITESDLYLRFVVGAIDSTALLSARERHIRCNPVDAQFIVDPGFEPVVVEGPFAKQNLDAADVRRREELLTRGWRRLQELSQLQISVSEYPLPEVLAGRTAKRQPN